ncbi:MAG TPA: TetR/AcrR family transcriptional regulator [Puia sp.]|nr:TetR/AcrR family transcriptional regulator [Puia sp.]
MSKAKKIVEKEASTEEKIKAAAKKLFTQKGFAATRTRDIAEEAGINLALLNYYFRSKEKLYDIIMLENFRQFIQGISVNVFDEKTSIEEKLEKVVIAYIDFLSANPNLPLFVLNEIKGNPSRIAAQINEEVSPTRSHLLQQVQEAAKAGKIAPIDPFHFIANLVGLTIFPFIGRPILQRVTNTTDEQFLAHMEERKRLVPIWLKAILSTPITTPAHAKK